MIAVFLAPLYILVNVLIGIGFNKWLNVAINMYSKKVHKTIFLGTYILFSSSILLGFLLPNGQLKRIFALFGNYYLGILLYLGIFSFLAYLIYLFLLKNKRFNVKKVKSKKTKTTETDLIALHHSIQKIKKFMPSIMTIMNKSVREEKT